MKGIGCLKVNNRREGNDDLNYKETAEQLELIGQKILCAARDELDLGMRFLDVALSSFRYQMDTEVSPFGTDGATIYFHPRELGGRYRQNRILVNRGYLHMVYHCLFRHMLKIVPEQEGNGKELAERYWNLACDIAVECLVDQNMHRSVRYSRSLRRRETYRKLETDVEKSLTRQDGKRKKKVLNAERIYKELFQWKLSEKELEQLEQEFFVDDHRYWENKKNPPNQPNPELNQKWRKSMNKWRRIWKLFQKKLLRKAEIYWGSL